MALHVTQQNVEVLSDGSGGKLRVTQQYVEVMGASGSYQAVSQSLGITDSASETDIVAGHEYDESVSHALGVTDTATEFIDHPQSVSQGLGVTDAAMEVVDHGTLAVTDNMSLADTASWGDERAISVSNALSLTDTAIEERPVPVSASSDLSTLADSSAGVVDHAPTVSDSLALTDQVAYEHDDPAAVTQNLGLTDAVQVGGTIRRTLTDSLTLTDGASLPVTSVSAQSDLSILTDSAVQSGLTFASASDTLALQQSAAAGVILISVSNAMALVQTPYVGQNITASASSAITLTQTDVPGIYFAVGSDSVVFVQLAFGDIAGSFIRSVNDSLGLTSTAAGAVHDFGRSIADTLILVQTLAVGQPKPVSVTDILSLANIPSQHQGVANLNIADPMDLKSVVSRILSGSAHDTLTLTHAAFRRFFASNVVTFVGTAIGQIAKPFHDNLGLTDALVRVFVARRPVVDNLELLSSAAAFISTNGALCQYAPYIGAGPGAGIPATMPTLGNAKVTLTYPFVSPTTTLVLRNPQFGNVDRLSFDRINRETRGGTLIMFTDPDWPKQQTLNVTIVALKRQQKDDLLAFLNLSVGQDIGLLDHENRQWKGIILTPEASINNNDRGGYTVTFEFEGALQ